MRSTGGRCDKLATGMALSKNVKTALDETRTLMLGAQILLGFQYQSAFQEVFDELPFRARCTSAFALILMLATVGLLIAPSAFHRIAEHGESTGRVLRLKGRCAAAALLPFGAALGLDLGIALDRAFRSVWAGSAIGAAFAFLAFAGWYGLGGIMKRTQRIAERRETDRERCSHERAPLHIRIEQMLTEARVILPGAQALLGFQLAIVLTNTFDRLPDLSRLLHGLALLCVSFSIILLITPASLHRIAWGGDDSEAFARIGGRITVAALLPLALGMAGDVHVVITRIFGLAEIGGAAASIVFLCLLGFWWAWPLAARRQHIRESFQYY
jgi:hypothetical protein